MAGFMTYTEQIRAIIAGYQATYGEVFQTRDVALWAIRKRLWQEHPDAPVQRCAQAIARTLREERLTCGARAKHAVSVFENGVQLTLWADIRTAPRKHLETAFRQRRAQILADCRQLYADLHRYNTSFNPGPAIQLSFDFEAEI